MHISLKLKVIIDTLAVTISQIGHSEKINPLSANPTKWSNTLKQFIGKLPTNCLSVFDHFVILALKGLKTEGEDGNIYTKKNETVIW